MSIICISFSSFEACAAQPCTNGGVCTNTELSFSCACTGGYTGPTCAVNAG